jgi:hypothetical protein
MIGKAMSITLSGEDSEKLEKMVSLEIFLEWDCMCTSNEMGVYRKEIISCGIIFLEIHNIQSYPQVQNHSQSN